MNPSCARAGGWPSFRHAFFWCAPLLLGGLPQAGAAGQGLPGDTVRVYELGAIEVEHGGEAPAAATSLTRIALASIARADAATADRLAALIPSAFVVTNSRGESLLYLRNAGERQVALFFEGAPLNAPWDNRMDLSLVPAAVVGGLTVVRGVPPVVYGPNVLGGVVNLLARTLEAPGSLVELAAQGGSGGQRQASAAWLREGERASLTLSATLSGREGLTLPADPPLAYHQGGRLRTNTDARRAGLFGRAAWRPAPGLRVGVSALHLEAAKGVAPEGHLSGEGLAPRFWRMPLLQETLVITHAEYREPAGRRAWKAAAWGMRQRQEIEQYGSAAYDRAAGRESGRDRAAGVRAAGWWMLGPGRLEVAAQAMHARHEAREQSPGDRAVVPPLVFSQQLAGGGVEYRARLGSGLEALAGASVDAVRTPRTGDKPPRDPIVAPGGLAGLVYRAAGGWTGRATFGWKSRFPTMRELFGEALGRFLVNPRLKPESAFVAEAGLGREGSIVSGEAVLFVRRVYGTIDQEVVRQDDRTLRRRVNLSGSRTAGIELSGRARPAWPVEANAHLTVFRQRAFPTAGIARVLTEKPDALGRLSLRFGRGEGFSLLVEGSYVGRAWSLGEEGGAVRLPAALVADVRASFLRVWTGGRARSAELFVRVNNVADEVVLPQLGLPGPGRELLAGLKLTG